MAKTGFNTPILILAFNRPDTTGKIIEKLKEIKPKKIYVHIDGPRNIDERKKVDSVKKIFKRIDWPCKIKKFYRKKNIGILSIVDAYKWFFKSVEYGIILEDDALPSKDFFAFAEEILVKHRKNPKVMYLSGCNFQRGWTANDFSYYFSIYPYTYAFATWRRAWKKYDYDMKSYPKLRASGLFSKIASNKLEKLYIMRVMDEAYYKNKHAIDTRWWFSILKNKGLCIVPNNNLVKNIGFTESATHTKKIESYLSRPIEKIEFPLKHPSVIARNRKADKRYIRWLLFNKIKKYFLLKTGLSRLIR